MGGLSGAPKAGRGAAGMLPGVSVEGLERAVEMCELCQAYGSAAIGAQLRSKQRRRQTNEGERWSSVRGAGGGGPGAAKGGKGAVEPTNAELVKFLIDTDRDMFSATQEDVDTMATSFVANAEARLAEIGRRPGGGDISAKIQHAFSARAVLGKGGLSLKQGGFDRGVTEMVGGAWRIALRTWLDTTVKRMNAQVTSYGDAPAAVSLPYAEWRRRIYNVPIHIVGKKTGQLTDNFASGDNAISIIMSAAGASDLGAQARSLASSSRWGRRMGKAYKGARKAYKGARKSIKKSLKTWANNRKIRRKYGF